MSRLKTHKHKHSDVIAVDANFLPMQSMARRKALKAIATGRALALDVKTWAKLGLVEVSGRALEVIVFTGTKLVPDARLGLGRGNRAILRRDKHECQVRGCNARGTTIDHLVPRAKGGKTTWENCVAMCRPHNEKKADRTLAEAGLELKHPVRSPRYHLLVQFQELVQSA